MCGIAGIFSRTGSPESLRAEVGRMTATLAHRGPDDTGLMVVSGSGAQPVVVFGHRRLAIIDLSPLGHQPMTDPATGNWLAFNGEIYNYRELRDELTRLGQNFASQSDTEVILKCYAQWGPAGWGRLNGIFAFALWDARARQMFLVRDQLGVKPLYFSRGAQHIRFASEVRALIGAEGERSRLSLAGVTSMLRYGSVQEPVTLVEGILSLDAGEYLRCDATGEIQRQRYWEPPIASANVPASEASLLDTLDGAVRRQLVADVPVGIFLSGGIDSAAIAALAARAAGSSVRTFCVATNGLFMDEAAAAQETANYLGTQHTTIQVTGDEVSRLLREALPAYDQPSMDGVNTYLISRLVREAGIKVALSGLGGDELFVGYRGFEKARAVYRIAQMAGRLPKFMRRGLGGVVQSGIGLTQARKLVLSEVLGDDLSSPYFGSRIIFGAAEIRELLDLPASGSRMEELWRQREAELSGRSEGTDTIQEISRLELQTYMLSTLLRDADQMSMAHALELRVPLIDRAVVEHVLPIRSSAKLSPGRNKPLLVDALKDILPPGIDRRPKQGFTLPFKDWMRGELRASMEAVFLGSAPAGPWRKGALPRVWQGFQAGRVSWSRVFTIYSLEQWLARWRVTL